MQKKHTVKQLTKWGVLGAALLASTTTFAKDHYACVNNNTLNIRSAPSTQSAIVWKVVRHYPSQILASQGVWRQVKDFEGDIAWAHSRYLSDSPCVIVKNKIANIRTSASQSSKKLGQAEYGDVFAVTQTTPNWVQIQIDSKTQGWIYAPLLWGTPN